MRRDERADWISESKCVGGVCSYSWIRGRGHSFGRASALQIFGLLRAAFDPRGVEERDSVASAAARRVVWRALQAIYDVL